MKKSRFTEEQIVFALKQAELGTSVPEVCRKLGISDATFYIWRKKYGGISPSELKHMRQLEEENLRLKKLVADLSLDKAMLQDVLAKKELTLARLREWVRDLQARYGASERQVCFALQISRSSFRYRSVAADDSALRLRIREITEARVHYGYRRVHVMLRRGAGGIITNAFTGSIANRVCPCVSNACGGTNRRSGDNRSLRGCIRIMSGSWILSLTPYLTGVGYVC